MQIKEEMYLIEAKVIISPQYGLGDVLHKARGALSLLSAQLKNQIRQQLTTSPEDGGQKPQLRLELVLEPITLAAELMVVFRSPRSVRASARMIGASMIPVRNMA